MRQQARLITPDGEKIDLPPDIYRQVKKLLNDRTRRQSRARAAKTIEATYGKYAGGDSLTHALLRERAAEREREEAKSKRLHG